MEESITGKVLGATERSSYLFSNAANFSNPLLFLDILIVAILFYWVYIFLRETRAMRILYGFSLILILMTLGRFFNLVLLNWILKYFMTMLVVAIPVVFQPELRAALEKLGRNKFIGELAFNRAKNISKTIEEIVIAVEVMSKEKIGALIVIQRQTGLREYIESGKQIRALVSADILRSIFFPKSPLHDGAVIIMGEKIISAKSVLPPSDSTQFSYIGMRHRAGIGITENSDAISVIVSEETGTVSVAVGGKLERRVSSERLRNKLIALLRNAKG